VDGVRSKIKDCAELRDLLAFMERSERGFVK
jgi:hypothetical protein